MEQVQRIFLGKVEHRKWAVEVQPTGTCLLMAGRPFRVQSPRNEPGGKMHLGPEDKVESVGLEHRPIQIEAW